MTPDRIRGWLDRIPAGSKTVILNADAVTGLQEIGSWARKEVEDLHGHADGDVADFITQAAQEFANGEGETKQLKFLIQWKGTKKGALRTATHWATAKAAETEEGIVAPGISDATIIRDLLKALSAKDKVLMDALTISTGAYEKTIGMLSGRLDLVYKELDENTSNPPPLPVELTEQEQAESAQRQEAMGILMDKAPDLFDLGMTVLTDYVLKKAGVTVPASDDEEPPIDTTGEETTAGPN